MFIIEVIPAIKIPLFNPQILTYFTSQKLCLGSLVSVPVNKKQVLAVVLTSTPLESQKMSLKKADFELKAITKIISPAPILNEKQISLAKWMHQYYWTPLGLVIKMMLPKQFRDSISNGIASSFTPRNDTKKQKLILFPEISLLSSLSKKYAAENIAVLHSQLKNKDAWQNWLKIKNGQAEIIIGTRQALLAPFINLKKIVVEEEHNPNYKSPQTPRFHTRETSLKLAQIWNAQIVFKSPTPSIETYWLAKQKKLRLEIPDINPLDNGQIKIIDMRQEIKTGNFSIFSQSLQETLKNILKNQQQAILFLNRRGGASFILCRDCGYVAQCPNCEVPLVYHLAPLKLICHHCNYSTMPPSLCPQCSSHRIKLFGAGTQKVEIELQKLLPEAQILRLDKDIAHTIQIQNKIIDGFKSGSAPFLIATQMLFSHFLAPVGLVALVSADTVLHLSDWRSNERTFQIIQQLKNFSCKDFLIQTYTPDNLAIQAAAKNDYQTFYQEEIQARKILGYPPFVQLIKLTYQHQQAKKAENEAGILAKKLKQQIFRLSRTSGIVFLLGPAPAFIPKIRNKFIWQIILKIKVLDSKGRAELLKIVPPGWIIDIDPEQNL